MHPQCSHDGIGESLPQVHPGHPAGGESMRGTDDSLTAVGCGYGQIMKGLDRERQAERED